MIALIIVGQLKQFDALSREEGRILMTLKGIMILVVLAVLPITLLIWFISSLIRFRRMSKKDPMYEKRRVRLLISGVILFWLITFISMFMLMFLFAMSQS